MIKNDTSYHFLKTLLVFKQDCSNRTKIESWVRDEGVINAIKMEFGTLETILGSVIAGLGITILPNSTRSLLGTGGILRIYHIPKKYYKITTVFIRHTDSFLQIRCINLSKRLNFLNSQSNPLQIINRSYMNKFHK